MKSTTVLVVEDNEITSTEVTRVLREHGFSVLQAYDAETALQMCKDIHVSIVLLDIVLPGMTGLQLFHELFELKPTLKVVLTSFARPPQNFQLKHPNFKFIEKNHDMRKLPSQLTQFLDSPILQ
jgi:DNA-binding NtrC family response regulator